MSLDLIAESFLNRAYDEGEWLLKEGVLIPEDLEECENVVLCGIPSLAILHCIERSSKYDDGLIHLSSNRAVDPQDPRFEEQVRTMLQTMLRAKVLVRQMALEKEGYDVIRRKLVLKYKFNVRFVGRELELFRLISGLSLVITQIELYKLKFKNVIELLKATVADV